MASPQKLIILSSSDFPVIDEIIAQFNQEKGYAVELRSYGLWDWFYDVQGKSSHYDGILTNNSDWIKLSDNGHNHFGNDYKIAFSPIALGIKPEALKKLGLEKGITGLDHLVELITNHELSFAMASGSKSHSGIVALLEILAGFNYPQLEVDSELLQRSGIKNTLNRFFKRHQLSGLSSLWLKQDFLRLYNYLDIMINYESYLIQCNQELVKFGQPALKIIYLNSSLSFDGPVVALNNKADETKQKIYKELVDYLSSDKVKNILDLAGFRSGDPDKQLPLEPSPLDPSWLVSRFMPPRPKSWPDFDLLVECLNYYQEELRKPVFQIMALDFSGSMDGRNQEKLFSALKKFCNQEEAKKYFHQYTPKDRVFILPFNHDLIWENPLEVKFDSVQSTEELCHRLTSIVPSGGTDIYKPLIKAMEFIYLTAGESRNYQPTIVLLTDGTSNADRSSLVDVKRFWRQGNFGPVPPLIFPILYGTASLYQLSEIAEFTNTRVVDGRKDLNAGFFWAKSD